MKVFFASDLHVDVPGNADFAEELAALAAQDRPDVVILAGDLCNGVSGLPRVLRLFAPAGRTRIYVPGNHELWALDDPDSRARERYYREIPRIARAEGFHPLVTEGAVFGDVGFVGTMGWYDYSLADPAAGFTEAELASKRRDGLEWMDRRYVRWTDDSGAPLADRDVAELMVEDLRDQLDALAERDLRAVVVVTHHLAFREVMPPVFVDGHLKFFGAFLGSTRLGDVAASDGRVVLALAGHVHSVRQARVGTVDVRTCPTGYPRERKPGETAAGRRLLLEV